MPNVLQVAAALYSKQIIKNICSVTHFFLLVIYWLLLDSSWIYDAL